MVPEDDGLHGARRRGGVRLGDPVLDEADGEALDQFDVVDDVVVGHAIVLVAEDQAVGPGMVLQIRADGDLPTDVIDLVAETFLEVLLGGRGSGRGDGAGDFEDCFGMIRRLVARFFAAHGDAVFVARHGVVVEEGDGFDELQESLLRRTRLRPGSVQFRAGEVHRFVVASTLHAVEEAAFQATPGGAVVEEALFHADVIPGPVLAALPVGEIGHRVRGVALALEVEQFFLADLAEKMARNQGDQGMVVRTGGEPVGKFGIGGRGVAELLADDPNVEQDFFGRMTEGDGLAEIGEGFRPLPQEHVIHPAFCVGEGIAREEFHQFVGIVEGILVLAAPQAEVAARIAGGDVAGLEGEGAIVIRKGAREVTLSPPDFAASDVAGGIYRFGRAHYPTAGRGRRGRGWRLCVAGNWRPGNDQPREDCPAAQSLARFDPLRQPP